MEVLAKGVGVSRPTVSQHLKVLREAGLVMTWHLGTNAEFPTKVDVCFKDIGGGRAPVTLTHSGREIWAEKADELRSNYNGGWVPVFESQFATACT